MKQTILNRADLAAWLGIEPDHLEWHGTDSPPWQVRTQDGSIIQVFWCWTARSGDRLLYGPCAAAGEPKFIAEKFTERL